MKSLEMKKQTWPFEKGIKQVLKKVESFKSCISVEPVIICYVLPSVLTGLAVQNLCLEKACLVNMGYDKETCAHIMAGDTRNHTLQEKQVQSLVASTTAWSYPLQTAVPGIFILFFGSWSDRTQNRKTLMLIPTLGKMLSLFGIILSTYFFLDVGLNVTSLIEGFLPALTGGRAALSMAAYSYITDITTEKDRTFRLGIVTACLTLTRSIGLSLSGVMTKHIGYYGLFTFCFVMYTFGFIYAKTNIEDPKKIKSIKEEDEDDLSCSCASLCDVVSLDDLKSTMSVAIKKRDGTRRMQILLTLIAYMLIVGPVQGEVQLTFLFTRYKFKFSEIDYSLFLTYSVVVGSLGSVISIYVFTKRWGVQDSALGIIAGTSRILASLIYAFAPTRAVYYLGPLVDMFSSTAASALRAIFASLVDCDDFGKAGSLIGISEAFIPVVYSPIYSKVYLSTLSTFSGAFYLISAGLALPAITIFIIMYSLQKKRKKSATFADQDITRF